MDLKQMQGAVVVIAMVALFAAAGAIGVTDFREDTFTYTNITNETISGSNTTGTALAHVHVQSVVVWNLSVQLTEGVNFTVDENNGIITLENGTLNGAFHGVDLNVTYNYAVPDYMYNITASGQTGIINTTDYLGTIGTIIGVAVLIGLVVGAFAFYKR